jgi:hypothetical protein
VNMKLLCISILLVVGIFSAVAFQGSAQSTAQQPLVHAELPLQLYEQVPLPGLAGRIDHFTADKKRRRVIFSALGNNSVEVVDAFAGAPIRSIKEGLSEPQGVLFIDGLNKLFVANAGNGKVMIFNGDSFKLEKTIEVGDDPDNLRYHEATKRVIVGYGSDGGAFATFDAATGERVGKDLKIDGHPESFEIEQKGNRIFVNVPDARAIEVVDRNTGAVAKWPLTGVRGNYAMALNEDDHRLFVSTRKIPMFLVFDTESGREVARMPAVGSCDDVSYDALRKRAYVIGAQGFISVFQQKDPEHYELLANVPSAVGVRTGYFFVRRDRLYVGVPARGNEPAQLWTYEAQD